jgi:hypothetical protein
MLVTFGGTLALPVEQAVAIGVALAVLLHLWNASLDVRVTEIAPTGPCISPATAGPAPARRRSA